MLIRNISKLPTRPLPNLRYILHALQIAPRCLLVSVVTSQPQSAEALIHCGADVNGPCAAGWTPLHVAAMRNATACINVCMVLFGCLQSRHFCCMVPMSMPQM